ncbi:hypothetical protein ACFOZ0_15055 [Streptomyces yaanensis]|uniref:Uncharacterized protein n=1 Tax=Streptomyces yaanensis TaxID=1142239 RepID=A0ABV7SE08_9ACTN|nr:hypothetical protein [Streptomyces sp. CGMCC 4.7035]WNB98606.1 hypothetical protein Q2K21_11245 [Streptomyces sp. CGMCC 4.7035]
MMFDPGQRAPRQQLEWLSGSRADEYANEARRRSSPQKRQKRQKRQNRQSGSGGLAGLLTYVVLVAAVVLLARDAEFRTAAWTFIRGL